MLDLFSEKNMIELAGTMGRVAFTIIAILVISVITIKIMKSWVDRLLPYQDQPRVRTISGLIKNGLSYLISFIAIVMILERIGINTGSLVAAAGIGGVAIGFGAQNLVRDVVTGFFIVLEDQYDVGDHVTITGVGGLVEEIGLRVTKIRDFGGELHIIPNGEVKTVTNHMGEAMRVLVEVDIAYEVDVDKAIGVLEQLFAQVAEEVSDIVDGPKVLGVQDLGDSGVKLMTMAKTKPLTQWAIGRDIRKRIKVAFDQHGIEIPYPRRYLVFDQSAHHNS